MIIEADGGGHVALSAPQQVWRDPSGEDGRVMQTAVFAGLQMVAITDDAGAFDLHYLNHKTCGFPSMEAAKQAAPAFAREVLAYLSAKISDCPQGETDASGLPG